MADREVVTTKRQLNAAFDRLIRADAFTFDVETMDWKSYHDPDQDDHRGDPLRNDVVWISLASDDFGCAIPMGHPNGEFLREEFPLLKSGETRKQRGLPLRPQDYSKDKKKAKKIFGPPPEQLGLDVVMDRLEDLFFDNDTTKVGQNCFSGDAEAVVRGRGAVRLDQLVGQTVEVWTGDGWHWAKFSQYGEQATREVVLAPYGRSRSSIRHTYRATSGHRWILHDGSEVTTGQLFVAGSPGHTGHRAQRLAATLPSHELSEEGFRHGMVFADGCLVKNRQKDEYYPHSIRLCGAKSVFLAAFERAGCHATYPQSAGGDPVVNLYATKYSCKELPGPDAPDDHVAGFIEGWAALDGTTRKGGTRMVTTVNRDAALWLVENAWRAGYWATGMSKQPSHSEFASENSPFAYNVNLSRDDKMAWRVVSVGEEGPVEPVYCAEVLDGPAQFTLAGGILTGNCRFDTKSLAKYYGGEAPDGPHFDTMIAAWLLDSRRGTVEGTRLGMTLSLDNLVKHYLGVTMIKGVGKKIEDHTFDEVAEYSLVDSEDTHDLFLVLQKALKKENLSHLMKMEMDLQPVLNRMELHGAPIDVPKLQALHDKLELDVDVAKGQVFKHAGRVFNINSVPEKQALLYRPKKDKGRGLRTKKITSKTAEDRAIALGQPWLAKPTDAATLEKFRGQDALVDALLDYQDLNKLMGTYVIPYLGGKVTKTVGGKEKVTEKPSLLIDGRIHGYFKQNGAETSRMSSNSPNLQNIPNSKTENGKLMRELFYAPPGYSLVICDYSQIEPRLIASLSKDPILHGAYDRGEDVYTAMASPLGLDRAAGKLAVLAMSYGVGPEKIEEGLHLPAGEGKALLKEFERVYKDVYRYKAQVVRKASNRRPTPYAETVLGFRRYLPDLRSSEWGPRGRAERQAFNAVIQGSGAHAVKIAMIRADAELSRVPEANLTLSVHDEIVTLCRTEDVEDVARIVQKAMEGVRLPGIDIPLVADPDIGPNWASKH